MSTVGAALDSVLGAFEGRAQTLRALLSLRGLGADASALNSLEAVELQVSALEGDLAAVRDDVVATSSMLKEAALLTQRAERSKAALLHMQTQTNTSRLLLPGDVAGAKGGGGSNRAPLSQIGDNAALSLDDQPPPPPPPMSAPAQSMPRGARPLPPPLALVTDAELASAPSYMKSRLDVPKVNAALNEVNTVLAAKYRLLCLPMSSVRQLSETDRRRHAALKAAEGTEGKGLYFFSEEELKAMQTIKPGADGKNLLAVLRHVGRLKETKIEGQRCWQIR